MATQAAPYNLRERLPSPSTPPAFLEPRMIKFMHPGYGLVNDYPILKLPAFDAEGRGIHHGTALAACAIIAQNAFEGFLTEAKDSERLVLGYDELLVGDRYWFHVPSSPPGGRDCYPIVPCFENWTFPHLLFEQQQPESLSGFRSYIRDRWFRNHPSNLPPLPPNSTQSPFPVTQISIRDRSDKVQLRDRVKCRLTGHSQYCSAAHIIPSGEAPWWNMNRMRDYLPASTAEFGIEHIANAMLLRTDLHRAFDEPCFALVPKAEPDPGTVELVPHFTSPLHPQLAAELHDRRIRDVSSVTPAFLFARFAWTVLRSVMDFVQIGVNRWVVVRDRSTGVLHSKRLSGKQCRELAMAIKGSRSQACGTSLRKRARWDSDTSSMDGSEDGDEDDWSADEDWRDAKRSRLDRFIEEGDTRG